MNMEKPEQWMLVEVDKSCFKAACGCRFGHVIGSLLVQIPPPAVLWRVEQATKTPTNPEGV